MEYKIRGLSPLLATLIVVAEIAVILLLAQHFRPPKGDLVVEDVYAVPVDCVKEPYYCTHGLPIIDRRYSYIAFNLTAEGGPVEISGIEVLGQVIPCRVTVSGSSFVLWVSIPPTTELSSGYIILANGNKIPFREYITPSCFYPKEIMRPRVKCP